MAVIGRSLPRPLHELMQHFLTWATGKPLPDQQPPLRMSAGMHLFLILAALIVSGVASGAAYRSHWAAMLLPATWLVTVSSARTLFLTDLHAAIHGSFSGRAWVNRFVTDTVSVLLVTLPYKAFHRAHCINHHGPTFCDPVGDDDARFLQEEMGIRPGYNTRQLWRNLIVSCLQPRVHTLFLAARLRANLVRVGWCRRLASAAYLLGLAGLAAFAIGWDTVLVAWVFPLTLLYQLSALLGCAGEHKWFTKPAPGEPRRLWLYRQTAARFMGEAYPVDHPRRAARALWWFKLFAWYLPLRMFWVPSDLSPHDFHHRHPRDPQYYLASYGRRDAIAAGEAGYTETWGFFEPIEAVFTSISALPPLGPPTEPRGELMLSM